MSQLCALGENCDRFDRKTGVPGETFGYNLCNTCFAHSTADISALVYDYVDLSQIIARKDGHSEAKISRPKPASTPPIDLAVFTLRDDIEWVLLQAEYEVRHMEGGPQRDTAHARGGHNVSTSVPFLLDRLEKLAGLKNPSRKNPAPPDTGPEIIHALRRFHMHARRILGRDELNIALPGACPQCHAPRLSRRDGSETVTCAACGVAIPWTVYQKLVTLAITKIEPIHMRLDRNQSQP